jgi:hypothetical protein
MRTTLNIDDDVLLAAKELATKEKTTTGKILSEYFRRALRGVNGAETASGKKRMPKMKNGVPLLPSRGEIVTLEKVRKIMEDEGI